MTDKDEYQFRLRGLLILMLVSSVVLGVAAPTLRSWSYAYWIQFGAVFVAASAGGTGFWAWCALLSRIDRARGGQVFWRAEQPVNRNKDGRSRWILARISGSDLRLPGVMFGVSVLMGLAGVGIAGFIALIAGAMAAFNLHRAAAVKEPMQICAHGILLDAHLHRWERITAKQENGTITLLIAGEEFPLAEEVRELIPSIVWGFTDKK